MSETEEWRDLTLTSGDLYDIFGEFADGFRPTIAALRAAIKAASIMKIEETH